MSDQRSPADAERTATVEWRRRSADAVPSPLVRRVPYFECKLEHPELEPTGLGEGFFPDAVPYDLAGSERVFYWRPALTAYGDAGATWQAACATTDDLRGIDALPAPVGPLVGEHEEGVSLVVDGTIGGDTTTATVESYTLPEVTVVGVSERSIDVEIGGQIDGKVDGQFDGERVSLEAGERRHVALDERTITPVAEDGDPMTVVPELAVRYPGRRELHHPAPGTKTRLFPSFGLERDDLPRSVDVPTAAGELDHDALAEELGVALAERPYPERVLWQAFAYSVFDPHADRTAELAQLPTGHIVLTNPSTAE